MKDQVEGVGRFSVLAQGTSDSSTDINVGYRKNSGVKEPVTFEEAQNESGYFDRKIKLLNTGTGRYQIFLLLACGLVNMSCAISTTAVSFIAPAAEADFGLNSTTKGLLNGVPFLGMVFGAYFWGVWGDIKGRRSVILGSMGMDALFTIFSCLAQNVILFSVIRFGNGFAIIGAVCMIYVYLGEFLVPKKRDGYLLSLEIFWAVGMIAGPGVAAVVIPTNIVLISHTYFTFNAWRVFIFLTAVPSLISFIWIYQYPETPRYLMLTGRMIKSRDILEQIFLANNKNKTEEYSVESFTQTFSAIGFGSGYIRGMPFMMNLRIKLTSLKDDHKKLFFTNFKNITLTCIIEFCLMASYVTVLVWIPELFSRYYNYKKRNLDEANLCTASEWLLRHHNKAAEKTVSSEAYVAALIVALTTIPLIVLTGIAVKYFNKKILLFVSCGVPIVVALLITITKNDFQAEVMCCIFEGFTTLTEPIIFCTMVELFPSNVRGVAFSITVMTGRLGAVFGIFVFGVLIDKKCLMTFYLLAILLFLAFLAVAFLPKLKIGGAH